MGMVVVMDGDLEREMGTRDPVGAKVKKWGWLCAWGSMQVENNGNGMKAGVMGGGNRWYVGWMMMGSEDGHGYVRGGEGAIEYRWRWSFAMAMLRTKLPGDTTKTEHQ